LNRLLADVFQPWQIVDAGAADNAEHSLCHHVFQSEMADPAGSQAARNVRLYRGAIINPLFPGAGAGLIKGGHAVTGRLDVISG
jgi:hypothetical protein